MNNWCSPFRNVVSLFLSFLTRVSVSSLALFSSFRSLFFFAFSSATNTSTDTNTATPITLNQDKLLFAYDVIHPPPRRFIVCLEFIMRVMFQLPSCRLKYGLICELIHSFTRFTSCTRFPYHTVFDFYRTATHFICTRKYSVPKCSAICIHAKHETIEQFE